MHLVIYIKLLKPHNHIVFPSNVFTSFRDPTIIAFTHIFHEDKEFDDWFEEMKTFVSRMVFADSFFKMRKINKTTDITVEMSQFVRLSTLFNEGALYFGNYQGPEISSHLFNFEKKNKELFINKHLLNKTYDS